MLRKIFGCKTSSSQVKQQEPEEQLVPVPIPPLVAILLNQERAKGSPLSEEEVVEIRDKAVCMMMPVSRKRQMAEARGYPDINPEYAWEEWRIARVVLVGNS